MVWNMNPMSSKSFVLLARYVWKDFKETLQHNGMANRINKTLNKYAKCMKIHTGLLNMF